ncbi:MAG: hypothetical protein V4620_01170 [Bacteroidota bacterium]
MRLFLLPVMLLFAGSINSQSILNDSISSTNQLNGCYKPNILVSHPFGLFISRINHNFNGAPPKVIKLNIDLGSANVWLPEVKAYRPKDPAVMEHLKQFPWHKRDSVFQAFPQNYDSSVFSADGVIKTFDINVRLPFSKSIELVVNMRSFLLTQGEMPFSILTNDELIEFFHSKIAGGEDPFARKSYGLNKANIYYQDLKGNTLQIKNGQFVIPGIQFNLFHYLKWNFLRKHQLLFNSGLHIGCNTSVYNRSLDLGASAAIQKQIKIRKKNALTFALAGSILKQKVIDINSQATFSSSPYFVSYETMFEYRKQLGKGKFWQIGLNFYYQSAYNNEEDFDQLTPIGKRISPHWHLALTHLYRNNQNWSLISSYGKKWVWSFYLNEDFKVNNAPDIQTGIAVEIPISFKKIN